MTPQAVKAALESLLVATLPGMPTAWGNVEFSPPEGATWIRPAFRPGQSFEAEIGRDGLSRRTGAFIVQVFVPSNTGAGAAMETAAIIETAFRRQDIGGVECGEPYTNDVGESAGETATTGGTGGLSLEGWYQVNVIVPWWAWIGE